MSIPINVFWRQNSTIVSILKDFTEFLIIWLTFPTDLLDKNDGNSTLSFKQLIMTEILM